MLLNIVDNLEYQKVDFDADSIKKFQEKIASLIPDFLKKEQEIAIKTCEQSRVMTLG